MEATDLDVVGGLPFSRQVRLTDGKTIWADLSYFDLRMQVRVEASSDSRLKYDFTPKLVRSYDGNDILIRWDLTGQDTRLVKAGHYDLVISDAGSVDARGIQLLWGQINCRSLVSTP